ncbi:VanW family protein [Paenibacillus chartarius]|uniref:VanW family protein n=1 Tax=Paenibacillus chartarius TaxID=747481 RepID=A0ABV6DEL7_9BACL
MNLSINWLRPIGLALLAALLLAVGGLAAYGAQSTLPDRLTVSGWDVGGMSYAAFEAELQAREAALLGTPVRLRASVDGLAPLTVTYGQLGARTSAAALRSELERLRHGSPWARAQERWRLRGAALQLEVTLPEAGVTGALRPAWGPLYTAQPVDARRVISADDRVSYAAGVSVPRVDAPKLREALLAAAPRIAALGPDARPAAPVELGVPIVQEQPRITEAALRQEGIERKFAQFTTLYTGSSAGRQHNIESAAAIVNDMVLKPGDVFDYGKVIEETERKFGFQEAPVIIDGKIVPGIGGGICQVSTTLYNAVLRGGLEVVERRSHSLPISYVPMGQDATFSSGWINFRFRNNTGRSLLIRTSAENGRLTVKLFGTAPEDITYEVQSKIVKTIEPPVKYVRNPALRIGEQRKIMDGKRGFVVETTRYKKQNGQIIGEELVSRDTYSAQPALIGTNSGAKAADGSDDSGQAPSRRVEDGVQGPKFR